MRRLPLGLVLVVMGCGSFGGAPKDESQTGPDPAIAAEEPAAPSDPSTSREANDPAPPTSGATPRPACKVGFSKDVLPLLATTCGDAACHGAAVPAPRIDLDLPGLTYDELMSFGFGSLEWNDTHPQASGASDPEFRKTIDAWRLCGAKND